ncbi:MAG TPA: hypothetical protein VGF42_07175 [Caulobacteraceae bacterium]
MWLKPTDRPPTRCPEGGWTLRMLSAYSPITVRVTDEALNEVVPPNALSANIFTCRETFYLLADEKFARHELEPDGSITIRSADVRHV